MLNIALGACSGSCGGTRVAGGCERRLACGARRLVRHACRRFGARLRRRRFGSLRCDALLIKFEARAHSD